MKSSGPVRHLVNIALLALVILGVTLVLRTLLDSVMQLNLSPKYWFRDYVGNLFVGLLLYALIQRLGSSVLMSVLLLSLMQMGNGYKLAVLGTPTSPDDFINIQNLFLLADGVVLLALIAVVVLPLMLFIYLVKWRSAITWVTISTMVLVAIGARLQSEPLRQKLDSQFGNSVWNQPQNFKRRGLLLHVAQESARTMAKVGRIPSEQDVLTALKDISQTTPEADSYIPASFDKRNVHIIVLESFYDPMTLGEQWVPEDPFPAEFRALWDATGKSTALSPVFGGYTANAEFEVLCGFPVTENAVFFEGWLRRRVPCLPDVLGKAGYRTVASHPNVAGFWNRTLAYRLVGFDEYISKSAFDMSDRVGSFLLDHSYYDQLFEQLGPLDAKPTLNYMLTYHGHLPYPNNENYPDQIRAGQDAPLLHGYLNHLWYKSRDLMERLEQLRASDPSALIVIFGDHLPFLGNNYGVHTEALGLPADRADFTGEQFEYLTSTPLIVIDGESGPLKLGKMPLYRLPSLILTLLNSDDAGMFAWTANPPGEIVRPLYGMNYTLREDGADISCPTESDNPQCSTSKHWLSRTRTLIADIFTGKQYSLRTIEYTEQVQIPETGRPGDAGSLKPDAS